MFKKGLKALRRSKSKEIEAAAPAPALHKSDGVAVSGSGMRQATEQTGPPISLKHGSAGSGGISMHKLHKMSSFSEEVPGYAVGAVLGSQNDGLRKATDLTTNKPVAMKLIRMSEVTGHEDNVEKQISFIRSIDHPNICKLLTHVYTKKWLALVFELPAGGTLFDHISALPRYTEDDIRAMVTDVVSAIAYLHKNGIVHRGIHAHAIMVTDTGTVKIFNACTSPQDPHQKGEALLSEGTAVVANSSPLVWDSMPPEMVLDPEAAHSFATDMWSLGCVVYVLLMGFPAFWGTDQAHLYENLANCEWKFSLPYADAVSRASKAFVSSLLKADPDDRDTAANATHDAWLTGDFLNDIDETVVTATHLQANHTAMKIWNDTRNAMLSSAFVEGVAQQPSTSLISLRSGESDYMHPEHAACIVQAYVRGGYERMQHPMKKRITVTTPQTDVLGTIKEQYELGGTLGKGAFGTVVSGDHKKSKQRVAIKMIKKREVVEKGMEKQVQEEINLQSSLDHPGLVKILQVVDTKRYVCLVQELLTGGELFDKIVEYTFFSEKMAQGLVIQMLEAIKYLHQNKIAHRDLKPENILFETKDTDALMKITDFGYAHLSTSGSYQNVVGTLDYMAPEVFRKEKYDEKCDIWSAGVITFCMVCGCPPFRGGTDDDIRRKILNGDLRWPKRSSNLSNAAKAFIYRLLEMNPKDRYSAEEALNDAWLRTDAAPDVHLEASLESMARWNAVRKLRRGLMAGIAVQQLTKQLTIKDAVNKSFKDKPK